MDVTTVKLSKKHNDMLESLMIRLGYGHKKSFLEDMIEYFDRYPLNPRERMTSLDDRLYSIAEQFSNVKDELREIKKELKNNVK